MKFNWPANSEVSFHRITGPDPISWRAGGSASRDDCFYLSRPSWLRQFGPNGKQCKRKRLACILKGFHLHTSGFLPLLVKPFIELRKRKAVGSFWKQKYYLKAKKPGIHCATKLPLVGGGDRPLGGKTPAYVANKKHHSNCVERRYWLSTNERGLAGCHSARAPIA